MIGVRPNPLLALARALESRYVHCFPWYVAILSLDHNRFGIVMSSHSVPWNHSRRNSFINESSTLAAVVVGRIAAVSFTVYVSRASGTGAMLNALGAA